MSAPVPATTTTVVGERRVSIVDDEALARERLRQLLAWRTGYRVVAECADGDEALAAIEREAPELAFLDISMPGRSGVDVAQALVEAGAPTAVVFVTAHEQFALRAFEVSALDYLVKPVDRERFDAMLARVERRLGSPPPPTHADELRLLVEELRSGGPRRKRFTVRTPRGHYFVRTEDIEHATAEGNYVSLAAGGRSHLIRETMKSFVAQLDPATFVRVHRSVVVNVDRIARVEPLGHGEYRIVMQGGARFDSSRAYCDRMHALLG
jgi:two-component system LytT family response regulator